MNDFLDVFGQVSFAAYLTDTAGTIRMINRVAAGLVGDDPAALCGLPCWTVTRFETLDRNPYCGPECEVRRHVREGTPASCNLASLRYGGAGSRIDLATLPVVSRHDAQPLILHLLSPVPASILAAAPNAAVGRDSFGGSRLSRLSEREREVLELLALGVSSRDIGKTLSISLVTVRNHVHRILTKLEVHSRIEAVLALREQDRFSLGSSLSTKKRRLARGAATRVLDA